MYFLSLYECVLLEWIAILYQNLLIPKNAMRLQLDYFVFTNTSFNCACNLVTVTNYNYCNKL